jgi:hypothetical protein
VVWLVALRLELAHQAGHALVDKRLDLGIGDVGELEPEHVAGLGADGGEEAEEEDGVEDSYEVARLVFCPCPGYGGVRCDVVMLDRGWVGGAGRPGSKALN